MKSKDTYVINKEVKEISDRVSIDRISDYFSEDYSHGIDKMSISKEGRDLLYKMRCLFAMDGLSDKKLVNVLTCAYKQALVYNYDIAIKEIEQLIEIKLDNYKNFYYKYDDNEIGFNIFSGMIGLNRYDISAIIHETGHALHYYNVHNYFPLSILIKMNNASSDSKTIDNTLKFLKQFDIIKVKSKESDKIEEYYNKHLSFLLTKDEYNDLLNTIRNIDFSQKIKVDISSMLKKIIKSEEFTYDDYLYLFKDNFNKSFAFEYIQTYYPGYHAICDILDAIFKGKIADGNFKDLRGNKLNKYPGHGKEYYSYIFNRFSEVIANFSVIINSPNNEEMCNLLKEIIGEDLYLEIYNFYIKNIVKLNKNSENKRRKI